MNPAETPFSSIGISGRAEQLGRFPFLDFPLELDRSLSGHAFGRFQPGLQVFNDLVFFLDLGEIFFFSQAFDLWPFLL